MVGCLRFMYCREGGGLLGMYQVSFHTATPTSCNACQVLDYKHFTVSSFASVL
eukprot:SAG31_NODE_3810_length_3862_cov_2.467712_7_plen_52_part_01